MRRFFKRAALLAFLCFAASGASAWIIIIWIVIGGGGGGGGAITRSLAPDAVNDVVVFGNFAYLANGARGLQPVDLSNPSLPVRLPPLATGGYARSIVRQGNLVFIAVQEIGVQIFDVTAPDNPVLVTTLAPTWQQVIRRPRLVTISVNYLLVGTDSGEVIVFNGSGMTNQVGGISLGGNDSILSIVIRGQYAFVTVRDGGVQILDLTNPAVPVIVGHWPETGGTFPAIDIAGDYAYLAVPGGVRVLSLTNLAMPVEVGFTNVPGQPTGLKVWGDYLYVAAGPAGLQILSITNPLVPVVVGSFDTEGFAISVAFFDHYVIVADDLGGATIIDVTNPNAPVLINGVPPGPPPANDDFASRVVIPPSNCLTLVTGSSRNASKQAGEPVHAGGPDGRSVWWSWTAPFSGPVKISTAGSGFNTLLAIYTGTTVSNLTLVAFNDNASASDSFSAVRFDAVFGTPYQIAVAGYSGDRGAVQLSLQPLTGTATVTAALDDSAHAFVTGGNAPWIGQTCETQDGLDAAISGPLEASEQSWIETTVVGPGLVKFWCKVSSQADRDFLRVTANGVEQAAISGDVGWRQQSFFVGVGTNVVRWTYGKDSTVSAGLDAAWLDEVSFTPSRPAIPSLFGDLDRDGVPTVLDLTLLIGYVRDTNSLTPHLARFGDVSRDGLVSSNDISALANAILGRIALPPSPDDDGDGIPDALETMMGLNPALTNSPGDTLPDGERDFDGDGLANARELQLGTDPMRGDSDGDGFWDHTEILASSNPLDATSRPFTMAVAAPAIAFVLPANEGPGGLTNNTVVATPPVGFVLPANEGPGGLTNNTVVATPPVALVLPANEGPGGLTNNTVIALPPVGFQIGP